MSDTILEFHENEDDPEMMGLSPDQRRELVDDGLLTHERTIVVFRATSREAYDEAIRRTSR